MNERQLCGQLAPDGSGRACERWQHHDGEHRGYHEQIDEPIFWGDGGSLNGPSRLGASPDDRIQGAKSLQTRPQSSWERRAKLAEQHCKSWERDYKSLAAKLDAAESRIAELESALSVDAVDPSVASTGKPSTRVKS